MLDPKMGFRSFPASISDPQEIEKLSLPRREPVRDKDPRVRGQLVQKCKPGQSIRKEMPVPADAVSAPVAHDAGPVTIETHRFLTCDMIVGCILFVIEIPKHRLDAGLF